MPPVAAKLNFFAIIPTASDISKYEARMGTKEEVMHTTRRPWKAILPVLMRAMAAVGLAGRGNDEHPKPDHPTKFDHPKPEHPK